MMKLQKYLSQSGVCSRRKAEEYIAEGKITVNGTPAHIGQIVDPDRDVVKISDQVVEDTENLVYYKVNKPRGVVTTCLSGDPDEQGIMEIVDIPERVFPIGRLDKDTI
jgi:16S rRNA U516 pseudouridylate synthase RsuA-like enzyme